jgi:hypothetical protein
MWRAYWHSRALLARHPGYALGFLILRAAEVAALGSGLVVHAVVDARMGDRAGRERAPAVNE